MKQKSNNFESEIKFLIKSDKVLKIKKEILKIPAVVYKGKAYEKITMFDNSIRQMQKEDARLRVKQIINQENNKNSLVEFSYKRRIRADGGVKQEEEIEVSFPTDIDLFSQILNKMGYEITTSYERYRETFKSPEIKITLDEFPFGHVLEIEGDEENIKKICDFLNLDIKESYPLSCDDVYVDLCKKKGIKPKNHILFNDLDMPKID